MCYGFGVVVDESNKPMDKSKRTVKACSRERDYCWYIEPIGSCTNEIIGQAIADDEMLESMMNLGLRCEDNGRRDMWQVSRRLLRQLKASKKQLNLKFNTFVRKSRNGPIKLWIRS